MTPGPWSVWNGPQFEGGGADLCIGSGEDWVANMDHRYRDCETVHHPEHHNNDCPICTIDAPEITREQRANAEFIAQARLDLPLLVAHCRALLAEIQRIKEQS